MKICTVVGARPQFIKHAALEYELTNFPSIDHVVLHTGQHYDDNMSDIFFREFGLTKPDYELNIGSHSHGKQTAMMLTAIEEILVKESPDWLIVYGDTNSTLAGALAAKKIGIRVAHIEAGLRSFNMEMPEEINRIVTDRISDVCFCPSQISTQHLANEGIKDSALNIGDIMKDILHISKRENLASSIEGDYVYATIHRPYNTDDQDRLHAVLRALNDLNIRVIFSVHPRTRAYAKKWALELDSFENIEFINPVGYFDNISYIGSAKALVTDSGGMQKEAYWLKTRCLTIRTETEWVETVDSGWNTLIWDDLTSIQSFLNSKVPDNYDDTLYGDGRAAKKILDHLTK